MSPQPEAESKGSGSIEPGAGLPEHGVSAGGLPDARGSGFSRRRAMLVGVALVGTVAVSVILWLGMVRANSSVRADLFPAPSLQASADVVASRSSFPDSTTPGLSPTIADPDTKVGPGLAIGQKYVGIGVQRSKRTGSEKTYPVEFVFTAWGGLVGYSEQGCSGSLAVSDSSSGGWSVRETMGSGSPCDSGGVWTFVQSPIGTTGVYVPLSGNYSVSTTLGVDGQAPPAVPDCTQGSLSGATKDGARPFRDRDSDGRLLLDTFAVHACGHGLALVESSHSAGSTFNYWVLVGQENAWRIVAVSGVRLATPHSEPLFTRAELHAALKSQLPILVNLVGSELPSGRPLTTP